MIEFAVRCRQLECAASRSSREKRKQKSLSVRDDKCTQCSVLRIEFTHMAEREVRRRERGLLMKNRVVSTQFTRTGTEHGSTGESK